MAQEIDREFSETSRIMDSRDDLNFGIDQRIYNGLGSTQIMRQFFKTSNILTAFLAILIVGPIGLMIFERMPPYLITEGVTVPAKIKRGSEYRIEWKFKNEPGRCPGTIYRFLSDSNNRIWVAPPTLATFGYIDETVDEATIVGYPRIMPPDVALGPAEIHISMKFDCNISNFFWPLIISAPIIRTTIVD